MGNLAPHLRYLTISVISHLGQSVFPASDFSPEVCSWMLQLHCIISHLLSLENWLHTGTEEFFLFESEEN